MQTKDCVELNRCRLCNSKKLTSVFNLGKTPLANSYLKKKQSTKLKKYPLGLNLCKGCGHLQITHSIKPQKMFSNYLYKTNTSIKNYLHFKDYAHEITKLYKNNGSILDIASNDGTFLNFFDKNKFLRIGIDPAKNLKKIANSKGIEQIDDFFTKTKSNQIKKKYNQFDIITANHVCAHVENLNDFFSGVRNLLKIDGIFIFEVSYRGSVLKNNTFDTIYHEHLDYHALFPIKKFLKKHNLKLFKFKITKAQGGSLRVYASKRPIKIESNKILKQIHLEKNQYKLFNISTYKNFEDKILNCKKKLIDIINNFEVNKINIAGYGAAAKTTTLLYFFELNESKQIQFIIDDNNLKQGLYLPGTEIKILNPKALKEKKIDILILFAWNYADIILKKVKISTNLKNKKIKFLIPFPKPKIIE